jgi:hypothetical protein
VDAVPVGAETRLLALVDVGRDEVPVDLGNEARLDAPGIELAPGDPIRLTGTKTVRDGEVVIQASQIMVGSRVVRLGR